MRPERATCKWLELAVSQYAPAAQLVRHDEGELFVHEHILSTLLNKMENDEQKLKL